NKYNGRRNNFLKSITPQLKKSRSVPTILKMYILLSASSYLLIILSLSSYILTRYKTNKCLVSVYLIVTAFVLQW
ncbi:hypothetical protein L9F63_019452, partial [Diploptera punctata]